jgi:hypothetical protein
MNLAALRSDLEMSSSLRSENDAPDPPPIKALVASVICLFYFAFSLAEYRTPETFANGNEIMQSVTFWPASFGAFLVCLYGIAWLLKVAGGTASRELLPFYCIIAALALPQVALAVYRAFH